MKNLFCFLLLLCSFIFSSCHKGEDVNEDKSLYDYKVTAKLIELLPGYTYKFISNNASASGTLFYFSPIPTTNNSDEFSTEFFTSDNQAHKGFLDIKFYGSDLYPSALFNWGGYYYGSDKTNLSSAEIARIIYRYGFSTINLGTVVIDGNDIHVNDEHNTSFIRVGKGNLTNNNGKDDNSSGGSVSAEFEETSFAYDQYSNRIDVRFYFSDRVSNATIKYGKSSSCTSSKSASVSSKCASASLTGLTKNTKYYIKCVAKDAYGHNTTTGIYTVMTLGD